MRDSRTKMPKSQVKLVSTQFFLIEISNKAHKKKEKLLRLQPKLLKMKISKSVNFDYQN